MSGEQVQLHDLIDPRDSDNILVEVSETEVDFPASMRRR